MASFKVEIPVMIPWLQQLLKVSEVSDSVNFCPRDRGGIWAGLWASLSLVYTELGYLCGKVCNLLTREYLLLSPGESSLYYLEVISVYFVDIFCKIFFKISFQ